MLTDARAITQGNRSRELCRKLVDVYRELEWFVADYSDQSIAAMVTAALAYEAAAFAKDATLDNSHVVSDGSQNDGRPPVSATTLTNLKASAAQLKAAFEAPVTGVGLSSVSIANSIKVGN